MVIRCGVHVSMRPIPRLSSTPIWTFCRVSGGELVQITSQLATVTYQFVCVLTDGADMILTNTYQTSVEGYMEYLELDEQQSIELIKNTVRLAHIAKEKYLTECYEAQLAVPEGRWLLPVLS